MAVVFRDGCDSYGVTADILRKWDINNGLVYNATAGRNGGGAVQCTSAVGMTTRNAILSTNECVIAFWVKLSTTPGAEADFISFQNTGAAVINKFRLTTGGLLKFTTSANAQLSGVGVTNICDNQWHWIELKTKHVAGSAGGWVGYVDTLVQNNAYNASAVAGTLDRISIGGFTGVTTTFDDIIVWDDTAGGPQLASIPLGPRQITTARPDGDSAITFVPSTGSSNYALVDEQGFDSADYVESGTSGDQDLYDYAAIATSIASITDVGWNGVLMNPNPGTINYQSVCKSGGNTTLGISTVTPSSYSTKQVSYGIDPATSAAWANVAAINSAQFGIKVV